MKIVIDIPGSVYEGLDSPERGESRWAQNWAKFLANEGHQVICVCNPGLWGKATPIKNVELRPWSNTAPIECDIYINSAWWKGKNIGDIRAKTYVHMSYSLEDHARDPSFITRGHVLAYPYELSKSKFICERNPFSYKTFALPIPLAEDFCSSAFDRPALTFSAKDVFLDRHNERERHWYEAGKNILHTIALLAEKYDLPCIFLMAHELLSDKGPSATAVRTYGIREIIDQVKSKALYPLITSSEVASLLKKTKTLFPVISPGGSMIEGVVDGIVPLTWSGSLFDQPASEEGFLLRHDASYEQILAKTERLITDRDFYNRLLAKYQQILEGHLYKNSRNFFKLLENFNE